MNSEELVNLLIARAKVYAPTAQASIARNDHMNDLTPSVQPSKRQVEAVLVDFINYVGGTCGLDVGLYTADLREPAPSR